MYNGINKDEIKELSKITSDWYNNNGINNLYDNASIDIMPIEDKKILVSILCKLCQYQGDTGTKLMINDVFKIIENIKTAMMYKEKGMTSAIIQDDCLKNAENNNKTYTIEDGLCGKLNGSKQTFDWIIENPIGQAECERSFFPEADFKNL